MSLSAEARAAPPADQVAAVLEAIDRSAAFRPSRRHRALLRHLVTRALAGDHASLKESVLAVEVFGRPASRFDPKQDTIVRVETRRLRQRLDQFFSGEGQHLPVRIELPVGSYVPLIAARHSEAVRYEATRRARDLVERGQYLLQQAPSQPVLEQALARFDEALRESPQSVPALVGAARAWINLAMGCYPGVNGAADHAEEALQCALALDPSHAEAHALLGYVTGAFGHDLGRAEQLLHKALALAPELAFAHMTLGILRRDVGDFDGAEQALQRARQLDPMYVNARRHLVNLRIAQGRLDDAQAELAALLDLTPGNMAALALQGLIALERGAPARALEAYDACCAAAPGLANAQVARAAALGAAGRLDEADAVIAQVLAQHGPMAVSPYLLAVVAARCGRVDTALDHLAQAIAQRDPAVTQVATEPSFRALRADPRWADLVARCRRPATG